MQIKMTVQEALEFADEWTRGTTFHEGSQGWRVVCMLLAAEVRRLAKIESAPRWWHCDTHGAGNLSAWGCPDCVAELRRWKSTHAPRLEALEALLTAAQIEAAQGREARATLESERAANAMLTEMIEPSRVCKIETLRSLIANDAHACTFQSLGQYRTALLAALSNTEGEQ